MTTLSYHQFTRTEAEILEDIANTSATEVIIMLPREWQCNEVNIDFGQKLNELNVKLRPIYGAFRNEYYDTLHELANLPVTDAYFWGTYWFNFVESCTRQLPERFTYNTPKHKFISLNNRSHLHRCMFIDKMAKYELIEKGIVTWIKHLNENSDYPYQYYDNSQRLLDDDFVNKLDSMTLPNEYYDSLFDVITESNTTSIFLTEKTCFPIIMRKPFMIYGIPNLHQKLTELGFLLYDEVVDYSFDSIEDDDIRLEMLIQNVIRISEYDIASVYEKIKYKLHYNYVRMMELVYDNSYIPIGVRDFCSTNKQDKNYITMYSEYLNRQMLELRYLNIWTGNIKEEEQYIHQNHNHISQIILDVAVEGDVTLLDSVIEVANQYKIPIVLVTSTFQEYTDLHSNTVVINYPAYWIAKCIVNMTNSYAYKENCNKNLDIKNLARVKVENLFITMNNLAKMHRCTLMDCLAKYNLIEYGAITWRDVLRHYDDTRTEVVSESTLNGYKWKYWTPKKLTLDFEMDLTSRVEQTCLPKEYATSFMQIVTESDPDNFFLTEKTAVPLLFCKLFLVAGSKDFHKNLVDMGFVLYDELFDYSFDTIDDMETRYDILVCNLQKYQNHTMDELNILVETVRDKLEYNRNHAIKLGTNLPNDYKLCMDIVSKKYPTSVMCELNKAEYFKDY